MPSKNFKLAHEHIIVQCKKIHSLIEGGQLGKAEELALQLINQAPDNPDAIFTLATIYQSTGRFGLAISLYHRVLSIAPTSVPVLNNLGGCYHQCQHDEEAEKYYSLAYNISGGKDLDVLSNLAGLYINTDNPNKGLEYSDAAMAIDSNRKNVRWNRSLLCLSNCQWEEGFTLYDAGLDSGDRKVKTYGLPKWEGEEVECLVVCGEQGIGDELMFSTILPDLVGKVDRVILDCHPRLAKLFEEHVFKIEMGDRCIIVPNRKVRETEYIDLYKPSHHIMAGSLAKLFRKSYKDFKGAIDSVSGQFILTHEDCIDYFVRRIKQDNKEGKPLVGVSWFGGAPATRADLRSIPLEYMLPILSREDIHLVNLQYNVSKKDLLVFEEKTGVKIHHYATEDDYFSFAHLADTMDVVITVNNSMAHLCGVLGQKAFCLTPRNCAWRYGLSANKMIWYDSVELIRQVNYDDWNDPLREVNSRLNSYV